MASKGESFLLRSCGLAIVILFTSVWWASVNAHAQEAPPTGLEITRHSTSWSPQSSDSKQPPYLVIGMAERWNTRSYGSRTIVGDEATSLSNGDTSTSDIGPASLTNRIEAIKPSPLVLSSLTHLPAEPTTSPQTIFESPHFASAKFYNLLDTESAGESFLYGRPTNYLAPEQRLAESEYLGGQSGRTPGPLLQLEVGGWSIPVTLSSAAVSR